MTLAYPLALLLLPIPLLARFLLAVRAPAEAALRVAPGAFAAALPARGGGDRAGQAVLLAAWIALVLALAGPQMAATREVVTASGREILLALDLSGSMLKEDFVLDGKPLSRLDAVKRVAARFVMARRGDRIGLVIFGDRAYVAQPPTFDVASVARAIDIAQIGISGRSTAISDGLGLATRRIMGSDATSKVIVLLSDGVDTSGKVQAADVARLAASHGVRVHTIALGPEDSENQPASRDAVDAVALRAIAEVGGGTSFRVRDMADLEAMAATLDQLEPNPMKRPPLLYWRPLWMWPGALALALMLLLATWRRA
ncbi:Ca-activated chloride channel family protein [Ancylobacter aquaticus]|uniref:Ca-activated chloride channel family protein n=1 Tax=Ancylobacter aquaticus TaxID=100 RepID=A0A4R1I4Q8_ANCAQ|nr:VWA domain-containing protein [Ancylobacter aquaticus]TCK29011.1 Ca-activated chloride channel family protein [Ancylobacter aquaticus]